MIKSRGDVVQAIQISVGFGQAKNSVYILRKQDIMFEVDKDAEVIVTYPGLPDIEFRASRYKLYSIPKGSSTITANQRFNVGR